MSGQLDQIIGVLVGMAVVLVGMGYAVRLERSRFESRLGTFLGAPSAAGTGAAVDTPAGTRPRQNPLPEWVRIGASSDDLSRAGFDLKPVHYLLLQLASVLIGYLAGRFIVNRFAIEGVDAFIWTALGALVGLVLPPTVLKLRRQRRLRRFELLFPSAVDSLANALEAGLSLPQSLELLSHDMPEPAGQEFSRVVRQMSLGLPITEALTELHRRMPLNDVEIFVTAIQLQYRVGGSLSDILRTIAHTVRERIRIRGEIRVLTAMQRISAVIVSALPVCIALVIKLLNPVYFDRLLQPGLMRMLLIIGVIGIISGFFVMMRIADIEV